MSNHLVAGTDPQYLIGGADAKRQILHFYIGKLKMFTVTNKTNVINNVKATANTDGGVFE